VCKEGVDVVSPFEFLLWSHSNKELGPEVSTAETNICLCQSKGMQDKILI
jgi:hypothetical protein